MNNIRTTWTTTDELRFIDGLGTFMPLEDRRPRETLLRLYREALLRRVNWGEMSRKEVLRYLAQQ